MTLSAGTMLGPYEIVSYLGAGGMGEVYRARDSRLGRTVAVKVTRSGQAEDPQARLRFEREARAIGALNHPRICSVYDVGLVGADSFLVMEYLDGETLEVRLRRGPLPLPELFAVATGVGEALVAAHRAGIVHRDLKPSNVMLTRNGVKLLDFGIAKQGTVTPLSTEAVDGTMTGSSTVAGTMLGTVPYMAPEQLEGTPVDRRTDLFAFGSVLFEMATGRRAFGGSSSASQVAAILAESRPRALDVDPRVPPTLDRIISVCLAREPNDRWQDAADMVREIRWAEEDLGVRTPGPSGRRTWILHGSWAAAVTVLCALLGIQWWSTREAGPPPNARPVIVLMDSPLPGRVYDPRTQKEGGTNADDVTDALRVLPVAIRKENTSAVWHREEQVLLENPDLIVSHLSCLLDERVAQSDPVIAEHLSDVAEERLLLFFAYLAARNPRTHFIAYSRTQFARKGGEAAWLASREVQLPILRGRLHSLTVPGGREYATFREPATAELIRTRVREVLAKSSQ